MQYGASKLKDVMRAYLDEPFPKIEIIKERRFFRETIRIHSVSVPWSKRLYQRRKETSDGSGKDEKRMDRIKRFLFQTPETIQKSSLYPFLMAGTKRKERFRQHILCSKVFGRWISKSRHIIRR